MQQVAHMFYAMVFLLVGSSGNLIDWSQAVPEFREFHQRIWAGEVNLADNHTKTVYSWVHWEQLLQNMQQPRYNEAIQNRLRSECNHVKRSCASIFAPAYLTGQHAPGEVDKRAV